MINVSTMGMFDGIFTKTMKNIFIECSKKPLPDTIKTNKNMQEYLDMLGSCFKKEIVVEDNEIVIPKQTGPFYKNKVIVAFSGGKDSVACALKLIDKGYKPVLFFVNGVNRSYTMELDYAKKNAEILGCELVVYSIKISGKSDFIENPTKNHFILGLMVDEGLKRGINKYAFGSVQTDRIDTISNEYMLSDCYDLMKCIESSFFQKYIKGFKLLIPLKNETESFCIINKYDVSILNSCYSCMTPVRYKSNLIKRNEKKYDVKLLPNRCGSCYKCCQEAKILQELGAVDYNEEFLNHCDEIIDKIQVKFDATASNKDDEPWIDYDIIEEYKMKG